MFDKQIISNKFRIDFIGTFIFFSILFISAGRIDYWQGLIYVIIGLTMVLLNYTVLRIDSELLNERSKPGEGVKKWDKIILGLSFLITISMYITAGLDSGRYHWSPNFHWSIYLLGIILIYFCTFGKLRHFKRTKLPVLPTA